jgi:peptidoglycan hydrolase-like protein with peptidoglycan-binding domain
MYIDVQRGEEGQPKVVKRVTSAVPVKFADDKTINISDVDLYRDVLSGKKVIKSLTRPEADSIEDLQIRGIQTVLKNSVEPQIKVDGIFGSGTRAAVIKFQEKEGIPKDGIVGRNTISKMIDALKDLDVPVTGASISQELEDKLLSSGVLDESTVRITEAKLRKLIRESLIKLM